MSSRGSSTRGNGAAEARAMGDDGASCGGGGGGGEALTVGVDATEEVLVQVHLVEALEVLLPFGEEGALAVAAVEAVEDAEARGAQVRRGAQARQDCSLGLFRLGSYRRLSGVGRGEDSQSRHLAVVSTGVKRLTFSHASHDCESAQASSHAASSDLAQQIRNMHSGAIPFRRWREFYRGSPQPKAPEARSRKLGVVGAKGYRAPLGRRSEGPTKRKTGGSAAGFFHAAKRKEGGKRGGKLRDRVAVAAQGTREALKCAATTPQKGRHER